jgi:heat shock protein HslJ
MSYFPSSGSADVRGRLANTLRMCALCSFALCAAIVSGCSTHDTARPSSQGLPPVTPLMMPPQIVAEVAPPLAGRVWVWQVSEHRDGTRVVSPAAERYTLEFEDDGRVRVRADCNRGSGRYTISADNRLNISAVATTKMGCPPGSKDGEFLRDLASIQGYRLDGGNLVLLANDTGTMRFAPTPQ